MTESPPESNTGSPQQQVTQLRTRERRYRFLAFGYAAAAVWVVYASRQAWWVFHLAPTTVSPALGVQVQNVHATENLTASWLVSQHIVPAIAGMAQPIAFAVFATLLGLLSVLVRSSVVGAVALIAEAFTWHALTAAENLVVGHNGLVAPAHGLHTFELAIAFSVGSLILTSTQIAWINHRIRVEEHAIAKAAGQQLPPTVFELIHSMHLMHLGRFGRGQEVTVPAKSTSSSAR